MSELLTLITTHTVDQDKFDAYLKQKQEYTEYLETNEPDLIYQQVYSNKEPWVTSVLVFSDAEAADTHMKVSPAKDGYGLDLTTAARIWVYGGTPGPVLGQALQASADAGIPVSVKPRFLSDPTRFLRPIQNLRGAFGSDAFGRRAEAFARFFGTPTFLIGQTVMVVVWIGLNMAAVGLRWDPYPFILLNLAFSLQAAYAAPLILLAQTRQADRDKGSEADARHRDALAEASLEHQRIVAAQTERIGEFLEANTRLTEQVERLTQQIHDRVMSPEG